MTFLLSRECVTEPSSLGTSVLGEEANITKCFRDLSGPSSLATFLISLSEFVLLVGWV